MPRVTYEDIATPVSCNCIKCGEKATIYPCPRPEGACFCPNCSPAWLESFLKFSLNEERKEHGLPPIEDA